jgi:hypothetical protein
MKNKKMYQYTISLTKPMYPRKIADELSFTGLSKTLISVKDLQIDNHMYGSTYNVKSKQIYTEPFKTIINNLKRK